MVPVLDRSALLSIRVQRAGEAVAVHAGGEQGQRQGEGRERAGGAPSAAADRRERSGEHCRDLDQRWLWVRG